MIDNIDCYNKEQFKYINSLITGNGEAHYSADGLVMLFPDSILPLEDPQQAVMIYAERYNNKEIECSLTYDNYMSDFQEIISALGLDVDAFWLLIIFCYDYATSVCLNGIKMTSSPKQKIEEFIANVDNLLNEDKTQFKSKPTLTLKVKGKSCSISDERAIWAMLAFIYKGIKNLPKGTYLNSIDFKKEDIFQEHTESDSVMIWYFSKLLMNFFEINPQFKSSQRGKQGLSYSKYLLISQLIYHTRLSRNDNFLLSDETLKGYLKQYKTKDIDTKSNIYW